MALGDPYVTATQLKAYLQITDTVDDTQLADACLSASRDLEKFCGRQFNSASVVSSRVYAPREDGCVVTDDFSTMVGLVVAEDGAGDGTYSTTVTLAHYDVQPYNGIVDGEAGWPFWEIRPVDYAWPTLWTRAPVRVTALWGWATVPAPVLQAAYIMAADTFGLRSARFGVADFGQFGPVRVGTSKRAADKLAAYVRNPVLVS